MSNRLFEVSIRLKISTAEAVLLEDYCHKVLSKKGEIGHLIRDLAQEALEDVVAKATMYGERKDPT